MGKNKDSISVRTYQVEVKDVDGTVAQTNIPGHSKKQVLYDNQYKHCTTSVTSLGWAKARVEPTGNDLCDTQIIISSAGTGTIIFDEYSTEDMNKIEAQIHENGRKYAELQTTHLKDDLENSLNEYRKEELN